MKRLKVFYGFVAIILLCGVMYSCTKTIIYSDEDENGDGNNNREVQLLESMTYKHNNGITQTFKYEYDNQNRFSKLYIYRGTQLSVTRTIVYSGNLVTVNTITGTPEVNFAIKYVKNGNTITSTEGFEGGVAIIYLNNNEYPIKMVMSDEIDEATFTYQYQSGNMTEMSSIATDVEFNEITSYSISCKYDNKKSPFFYCKSPEWLMVTGIIPGFNYFAQNNMLEQTQSTRNNNQVTGAGVMKYDYEYDSAGFPIKCKVTFHEGSSAKIVHTYDIEYKYNNSR